MSDKITSILYGGLAMGAALLVVSAIPVVGVILCCLAVAGAGVISVWHYTSSNNTSVKGSTGALMGAASAAVAGLISSIVGAVFATTGMGPTTMEEREQALRDMEDQGFDPETLEQMEQVLMSDWFIPLVLGCSLLVYALIGAIGGMIGSASFEYGDDEPPSSDNDDSFEVEDIRP